MYSFRRRKPKPIVVYPTTVQEIGAAILLMQTLGADDLKLLRLLEEKIQSQP